MSRRVYQVQVESRSGTGWRIVFGLQGGRDYVRGALDGLRALSPRPAFRAVDMATGAVLEEAHACSGPRVGYEQIEPGTLRIGDPLMDPWCRDGPMQTRLLARDILRRRD